VRSPISAPHFRRFVRASAMVRARPRSTLMWCGTNDAPTIIRRTVALRSVTLFEQVPCGGIIRRCRPSAWFPGRCPTTCALSDLIVTSRLTSSAVAWQLLASPALCGMERRPAARLARSPKSAVALHVGALPATARQCDRSAFSPRLFCINDPWLQTQVLAVVIRACRCPAPSPSRRYRFYRWSRLNPELSTCCTRAVKDTRFAARGVINNCWARECSDNNGSVTIKSLCAKNNWFHRTPYGQTNRDMVRTPCPRRQRVPLLNRSNR